MASNPAIALLLQSWRPVGRVAELGTLGITTHRTMEAIIAILIIGGISILLSLPVILLLHLTRRWRHRYPLWLSLLTIDVCASALFLQQVRAPRPNPSGPTGPFGEAPILFLWLLAFLATLPPLLYAFIWMVLSKRRNDA